MSADAKAMMDALMGQHRNASLASDLNVNKKKVETCYDPANCPFFCVWGLDVYDLFTNTKSSIGQNPLLCSQPARDFYLKLSPSDQEAYNGEQALMFKLQAMVRGCDMTIQRNKNKLLEEQQKEGSSIRDLVENNIDPFQVDELAQMHLEKQALAEQIEKLLQNPADTPNNPESIIAIISR